MTAERESATSLDRIRGFILDLDGVVYRGNEAIPGSAEFLQYLEDQGLPFALVTNNATRSPADHVRRLDQMGVSVREDQVLTSATATASYLKDLYPTRTRVFAIGESGLRDALLQSGFQVAETEVRAVVVGMDRQLTYEKLSAATLLIRAGARFVGTNPDLTFPSEQGLVPGAGAILAAIEAATGQSPTVIGKPQPILFRLALARIGVKADRVAVVGDRLETDVVGGKAAGLTTILVLTGAARKEDLADAIPAPNHVLESLAELHSSLAALRLKRGGG